jgi:hypothetical protein
MSYEGAHSEEWAETRNLTPHEWATKDPCPGYEGGRLLVLAAPQGSTKSIVERGRKFYPICDFNLIEKHVCGNTAIPFDVDKLTPQVIDDTLDGALGETPDQPFVGSDLFGGTTSHAVLA